MHDVFCQTYTITNNSILNTTQIGSTVIYTYTANSDGAGNLGTNIIRNVTVVDYSPLNITSLSVSSNNSNNSYAKAGDQVNITIVTDGSDVGNMTGIILGSDNFTQNSSGGTIYLTKNIMQNDTNGNLTFNIRVTNSSEYAARVTHEDLIVDNIIIDTIRPNITLNGENNTVLMIDNPYTDAGATIYDLSYGSKIIQSTETVNISATGNYNLTYTAPDDYAGNLGSTITRNVTVVDLSPLRVMFGRIVSMIMLSTIRSSCVTLAAYSLEFVTRMLNVRLPFVSFCMMFFVRYIVPPDEFCVKLSLPSMIPVIFPTSEPSVTIVMFT